MANESEGILTQPHKFSMSSHAAKYKYAMRRWGRGKERCVCGGNGEEICVYIGGKVNVGTGTIFKPSQRQWTRFHESVNNIRQTQYFKLKINNKNMFKLN